MSDKLATLTSTDDVSIITLDDGKANVFSPKMIKDVNECLDKVPTERGALIITGREGMFSAGFDLKIISAGDMQATMDMSLSGFKLLSRLFSFPRPILAACSGHGIALGTFLLCCCDYRVGVKGDYMIGANEMRTNMVIPIPILELINHRVSSGHKYRAILGAEMYSIENGIGAGLNPNGEDTGLFITDVYTKDNEKKILQEFGIVFDGQYRENLMDSGIYEYIEPHYKSKGTNMNGLYTYNFSLNSNPFELQPSGAVNLTMFKKVELEVTTFTPSLDENAQVLTVCDADGVIIGINKPSWIIYDYTYTLRLYEEKYNILTFNSGNCGYMFVR